MKSDLPATSSVLAGPGEGKRRLTQSTAARRIGSVELFGASREVLIEHAGFTYRLTVTQANKLLLTK